MIRTSWFITSVFTYNLRKYKKCKRNRSERRNRERINAAMKDFTYLVMNLKTIIWSAKDTLKEEGFFLILFWRNKYMRKEYYFWLKVNTANSTDEYWKYKNSPLGLSRLISDQVWCKVWSWFSRNMQRKGGV